MKKNKFVVCVHDVTPFFLREIEEIYQEVSSLIGSHIVSAIVPHWHKQCTFKESPKFIQSVKKVSKEILLHGYYHRNIQKKGFFYYLTKGSNELTGLQRNRVVELIRKGQQEVHELFGKKASGFLAPAWQNGVLDQQLLLEYGLQFLVSYFHVNYLTCNHTILLNSLSWDCGRWSFLGIVGNMIAKLQSNIRRSAVPTIVFHPNDLKNNFFKRNLLIIENLLQRGYKPVIFSQLKKEIVNERTWM